MEDKFYTIDKIAELLGMHHKPTRQFITEGKLGASKVGKQWGIYRKYTKHNFNAFRRSVKCLMK